MNITRITLLSAVLVAMLGCDKLGGAQQNVQTQVPSTSESPVRTVRPPTGRYQIVFSPNVRADTFLLDTQKRRVWQFTKFSDLPSEPTAWNEVDVIDSTGEIGITFSEFIERNPRSKAAERKGKK